MRDELSSRDRLLLSIDCDEPDHVPLWNRGGIPYRYFMGSDVDVSWPNQFERIRHSLKAGIDDVAYISPPKFLQPDVKIKISKRHPPGERHPLLVKEYRTPKGVLSKIVRQTPDWPHGDDIPLISDHAAASGRSVKDWVEKPEDLEVLSYLFRDPKEREIEEFAGEAEKIERFAKEHEVLLVAHEVTYLGSAVMWLCGFIKGVTASIRRPEFLDRLLDIIHEWNMSTLRLLVDVCDLDLIVHYGWYDSTEFWSPRAYRRFIFPRMKEEVDFAHKNKVRFGYSMASGAMPLLETFKEMNIDLLYGIDPVQGGYDMERAKREIGDTVCLWGGVNAHVTLEHGGREEVRDAVRRAISMLAPGGGFILSSVGRIYSEVPTSNIRAMIETWRELADYPKSKPKIPNPAI